MSDTGRNQGNTFRLTMAALISFSEGENVICVHRTPAERDRAFNMAANALICTDWVEISRNKLVNKVNNGTLEFMSLRTFDNSVENGCLNGRRQSIRRDEGCWDFNNKQNLKYVR